MSRPVVGRRAVIAAGAAALSLPARAQGAYPERPVKFVVPFPPGQAADTFGRLMAERLSALWKQQVVVENKGGGAGIPAMEGVKAAAPDGYTLAVGSSGTLGINPGLHAGKLPYDAVNDFAPCSNIFLVPLLITAHPSLPVATLAELIALAKKEPGQLGYGSPGVGSSQHLAMELFKHTAGVDIRNIPYKGSGPAVSDLLGGHIKLMMDSVTSALPHVREGRIKAIAVTTAKRVPQLPDVPAIAETLAGFDAAGWAGVVAPSRTPRAIVEKISADMRAQIALPEVQRRIIELGGIPDPGTPEQYHAFIKAEVAKWTEVVRISGARVD
ncbi:tripartite tricarboxylate transporter substrate binding protein [Vineibacter terrae]|uniref:Bug family tripartite tricarboxylate transporter substrate binding protein n=1 Tax=Vineibacter terrae TaxID=2586908 RepID=UPI002E363151|nr:tripartite tricarboxylate transporter substrate binding protein [Vineibacter terrae]HEX2885913.1 tripartite tricarboxylate transporter substrate binding protein [Vineibacter terrae]